VIPVRHDRQKPSRRKGKQGCGCGGTHTSGKAVSVPPPPLPLLLLLLVLPLLLLLPLLLPCTRAQRSKVERLAMVMRRIMRTVWLLLLTMSIAGMLKVYMWAVGALPAAPG
jgi:hypothetical protein